MVTKDQVLAMRTRHSSMTANEIAAALNCNPAYVRATINRAKGYKPPAKVKISATEQAEREIDQRDLDILADLYEGRSVRQTAAHWGVSPTFVNRLKLAARAV